MKTSRYLRRAAIRMLFSLAGLVFAPLSVLPAEAQGIMDACNYTSVVVDDGGVVWTWGNNSGKQLGWTTSQQSEPSPGAIAAGAFIRVAAGDNHMLAVKADGTVWAWGSNGSGRLGDGTTTTRATPVQVTGLTGVTAVSGGSEWSMALKSDGTVRAWGRNQEGQLGDNSLTSKSIAVQVGGLTDVVEISAGSRHGLARKSDGTVWSWGANGSGQLGDGTTTRRLAPVPVSGLTGVIAISAGLDCSFALKSDGTVWAWGSNSGGRLGDGTTTARIEPYPTGLDGVAKLVAGTYHSLALKSDGTIWAWGSNGSGQLGDGTYLNRSSPVLVDTGDFVAVEIAAGLDYSMAMGADGSLLSWGLNNFGQLGDGMRRLPRTAEQVVGLDKVKSITGGERHVVAVREDGSVWTWGRRTGSGQWDSAEERASPVLVQGLDGAIAASAGQFFTLVLKEDGTVWSWGDNIAGELGSGNWNQEPSPVPVTMLNGVAAISAGGTHSLARKSDGTVWAWGDNWAGQLGNGTWSNEPVPVQIPGLGGVVEISAGAYHSLARKSDGTVWAWGDNESGQLGNGGVGSSSNEPIQVEGLSNIVQVSATDSYSLALGANGAIWIWGYNEWWEPFELEGIDNVVSIHGVKNRSFVIASDGDVWAWGDNANGELGNGSVYNGDPTSPYWVANVTGAASIAGTRLASFALKEDGTLLGWGTANQGELADGYLMKRARPGLVLGLNRHLPSPSLDISPPDLTVVPLGSSVAVAGVFTLGQAPVNRVFHYSRGYFLAEDEMEPFSYIYTPTTWGDLEINGIGTDFLGAASVPKSVRLRTPYNHDADPMPDWVEMKHFGSLSQGAGDDWDGDGLSNSYEFDQGLDPSNADFDGDGIPDGSDPDPYQASSLGGTAGALRVWTPLEQ